MAGAFQHRTSTLILGLPAARAGGPAVGSVDAAQLSRADRVTTAARYDAALTFCPDHSMGAGQLPAAMNALLLGGHVRVGLEDNLYHRQGELATNLQLTERVVRLVREMGFDPATPAEAREIMGLPLKRAPVRPHFALG